MVANYYLLLNDPNVNITFCTACILFHQLFHKSISHPFVTSSANLFLFHSTVKERQKLPCKLPVHQHIPMFITTMTSSQYRRIWTHVQAKLNRECMQLAAWSLIYWRDMLSQMRSAKYSSTLRVECHQFQYWISQCSCNCIKIDGAAEDYFYLPILSRQHK